MRLDKAVSLAGMTRAQARRAIADGRVRVNAQAAFQAGAGVFKGDLVTLDGEALSLCEHLHLMLYKPAGYLTATEDARGQKTVMELLPEKARVRKIGPVGRLDKDVTGLVLLTTDGQLAHRLISPKWDVEKRYRARVEGRLTGDAARAFENGVQLSDFAAKPARLAVVCAGDAESECLVWVTEGKFHQVKRMLAAVGHPVLSLAREQIGPIALDGALSPGESRPLTPGEEQSLYEIAGMNAP